MAEKKKRNKSARYRAQLKSKHKKVRARVSGLMAVRKPGGHMKRIKRRTPCP